MNGLCCRSFDVTLTCAFLFLGALDVMLCGCTCTVWGCCWYARHQEHPLVEMNENSFLPCMGGFLAKNPDESPNFRSGFIKSFERDCVGKRYPARLLSIHFFFYKLWEPRFVIAQIASNERARIIRHGDATLLRSLLKRSFDFG